MKIIGITGGVGSGKTQILNYLQAQYSCRVLIADEAARELEEPGGICYEKLLQLLGEDIRNADGTIHPGRMAERIFADRACLEQVNAIIHPAVKDYIREQIRQEQEKGEVRLFFVEAALLIECGYLEIVDEMWYIYAREEVRRERLKAARGYSEEKITAIMGSQLSEEEFRAGCQIVIDNSDTLEQTYRQIDENLKDYR